MSLHDAVYALEELVAGRRPDSARALEGLQALIRTPSRSDPFLELAADALQAFVVGGDFRKLWTHPNRQKILAAVRQIERRS